MEPVIQKYLTALETKDFEALAELFTKRRPLLRLLR